LALRTRTGSSDSVSDILPFGNADTVEVSLVRAPTDTVFPVARACADADRIADSCADVAPEGPVSPRPIVAMVDGWAGNDGT
jgi:hypothetical protein